MTTPLWAWPMTIDWDEIGILRDTRGSHDIRTDPLWILVIAAKQGHEGPIDAMQIEMMSGITYGPDEIQALAIRADRKRD